MLKPDGSRLENAWKNSYCDGSLNSFLSKQLENSKILKLYMTQKLYIKNLLMHFFISTLDRINTLFQNDSSKLHIVFKEIRNLFRVFARFIMKDNCFIKNEDFTFEILPSKWILHKNGEFMNQIQN